MIYFNIELLKNEIYQSTENVIKHILLLWLINSSKDES